jgi:hypothetical protein
MANLYVFHQGYQEGFTRTQNGQLGWSYYDGAAWSADNTFQNLGMTGSPSAVPWLGGICVLHQGYADSGQLWYNYSSDGQQWGGDTPWGQPNFPVQDLGMSESPSAVVYNNLLYVFHQGYGDNGQLWYTYYDGATWSADTPIPGVGMSGSPSAVLWQGGICVLHQRQNNNGQLWYTYSPDGTHWGGDTPWGQQPNLPVQDLGMSGSPSAVVYNSLLYVFHQGYADNGQLWYTYYDPAIGNWSPDTPVQGVGMSGSPSAVLWQGGISVLHQGQKDDNQLWYTYSSDGLQWGGDTPWGQPNFSVNDLLMTESPGCVVF